MKPSPDRPSTATAWAALCAALLGLSACVNQTVQPEDDPMPDSTPLIVLSAGTSEWGYGMTEVFLGDRVISTQSGGLGQSVERSVTTVPGAYDRVAAVLSREGPRAVARAGADQGLCPGSVDVISANPPVGQFSALTRPCQGDGAPFDGLWRAALQALASPG